MLNSYTAIYKGERKALVHCIEIYCTSPSSLQCCKKRKGLETKNKVIAQSLLL